MPISPEDVHTIVAMEQAPVRNLLITQSYHELMLEMRKILGVRDVSWCAYACWASKQAGTFIRGDEVPRILRRVVRDDELRRRRSRLLDGGRKVRAHQEELALARGQTFDALDALDEVVDLVSIYVSGGNLVVFEELGEMFARFIQIFGGADRRDEGALAAFLAPLSEGPSLEDTVELDQDGRLRRTMHGGQSLLRSAMKHLHTAMFERDPNKRAELILLCNAQCGLHEQIRLQPYIEGAQSAPVESLLLRRIERLGMSGAHAQLERLAREIKILFYDLTTELMMSMELPGGTVSLGRDLEATPGQPLWPPDLEHLEEPELIALTEKLGAYETREAHLDWTDRVEGWFDAVLAKLHLVTPEAQGSGARNWTSLSDRMRFIFELFRSRQQDQSLYEPPFSDAQVQAMRAGVMPEGPL